LRLTGLKKPRSQGLDQKAPMERPDLFKGWGLRRLKINS
jgi:hypothetical protein